MIGNIKNKTALKTAWIAAMLGLISITGWDLYFEYQRREALKAELIVVEKEEALKKQQEQEQARLYREQAAKHAASAGLLGLPPPPSPPPPPAVIEVSAADGIRIELQNDTSWQTVLQLLTLILITYGGIKVINRLTA